MTETIRIGEPKLEAKKGLTKPLMHLPNRLDADACLTILASYHPDWTVESLKAAGKMIDVDEVDSILEYTGLSLGDKMVFKSALSQFGIIARGKRIGS